jgi:hypothetical protein
MRTCRSCNAELQVSKLRPVKTFCNRKCSDAWHNALKAHKLAALREKYPEIYQEVFACE